MTTLKNAAAVFAAMVSSTVFATDLIVSPTNLNGWSLLTSPPAISDFVVGPDVPPLGIGSFQMSTGPDPNAVAGIQTALFNRTPLLEIFDLLYFTYVSRSPFLVAPRLEIKVDLDFDGLDDDTLIFEPDQQFGFPFEPVRLFTWQRWDARSFGRWRSDRALLGFGPFPWEVYTAIFPQAQIANLRDGSIRIVAGGDVTWLDFVGSVDAFVIKLPSDTTRFDFEPSPDVDGDGVPDEVDRCIPSDLRSFVDTGSGKTTIPNTVDSDGCSRQDYVNALIASAKSHGEYIRAIVELVNSWDVTEEQRTEAIQGAARSGVGR